MQCYFHIQEVKGQLKAFESSGRYHLIERGCKFDLQPGLVVLGEFKQITPKNGNNPFYVVVILEVYEPRFSHFDNERGTCVICVPKLKKGRLVEIIEEISYTNYTHYEQLLKKVGVYDEMREKAEKFIEANNRFKDLTIRVSLKHNGLTANISGRHYLKGSQRWEEPLNREVFVKFFINNNGLLDFEFDEEAIRNRYQATEIMVLSESIKFNSEGVGEFGDIATYESKVVDMENIPSGDFSLGNTVIRRYDVYKVLFTTVKSFTGQTIEVKTLLDSRRNVYEFDHEAIVSMALNNFELLFSNPVIRNLNYNDSSLNKNGDAGFFIAAAAYITSRGDEKYVTMKDVIKHVGDNDLFSSKFTNILNGFIARDEEQLVLVKGRIERLAVKLGETYSGTIYLNWNGMIVYHVYGDVEVLRWGTISTSSNDEFYSLERVDELNERCNTSFNKSDIVNTYGEFLTLCEELFDEVPQLGNTMFFAPLIETKFSHLVDKVKKVLEIIDKAEAATPKVERGGGSGFWTAD